MTWFNNLSLLFRFSLLGLLVIIAAVIPAKLYYDAEISQAPSLNNQLQGVEFTQSLHMIEQLLNAHRLEAIDYVIHPVSDLAALESKGLAVSKALESLSEQLSSVQDYSALSHGVSNFNMQFKGFALKVQAKSLSVDELMAAYASLLSQLHTKLTNEVLSISGLDDNSNEKVRRLMVANHTQIRSINENISFLQSTVLLTESENVNLLQTQRLRSSIETLEQNLRKAKVSEATLNLVSDLKSRMNFLNEVDSVSLRASMKGAFDNDFSEIQQNLNDLFRYNQTDLKSELLTSAILFEQKLSSNLSVIGAGFLLAVVLFVLNFTSINRCLKLQKIAISDIEKSNFNVVLDTQRKDELGVVNKGLFAIATRLSDSHERMRKSREERELRLLEAMRIEEALNATSTNVMIADTERNILFMNQSVKTMLRAVESDLQEVLPHFSVDTVLGSKMDIFHKNPAHQERLLEALEGSYQSNIKVAGLHFRLTANPIFDKAGQRIGSVVEWLDRTAEVHAEEEISNIVQEAAAGNFSVRATQTDKNDFMLFLANALNQLMETADSGLSDIARVLMSMSDGDMSARITHDYSGQFDSLKSYCNQTGESLSTMIGEIRNVAQTINEAATEIAQGNADLSRRTENQASNLEETASSMEQITATVQLNAENAQQANELATTASGVAEQGGAIINQVVTTMRSINDSAQKISDIIGVIDGIAFQTNILALNAAVEAARAGEQGRGFAVVASEVRTLAQRSANAAKDIKALISDSVTKIADGNKLVNQSGETMDQIVDSIKRVNSLMSDIASASSQQASGVSEINRAIAQMDEMTQQNAALVEQAAASAENLQLQSGNLEDEVARFKLADHAPSQTLLEYTETEEHHSKLEDNRSYRKQMRRVELPEKPTVDSDYDDDGWEEF